VRIILPIIALIASALPASAQQTGAIRGIVRDAETGAPLKGATARLRDRLDSTARQFGDLSDDAGLFSVEGVPFGTSYILEITFVGYQQERLDSLAPTAGKPILDIGEVRLRHAPRDMGEVHVVGQRSPVTVTADKTVYAVEDNPNYTATNVSELLGQIPSVDVDQDGKISLRGESDVTIMMNGRPLMMPADQRNRYLQSLPANVVRDIEIRTNPGAQFDAKNQSGIINIVTRRTLKDMIGGNINGGVDSRVGVNGGGGLYFNGENLNASLGGGINTGPGSGRSTSLRLNYLDSVERRVQGSGTSASESNSYYGYGQMDYKLSENDIVSLSFNIADWSSEFSSNGAHTFFNINDVVVGTFLDSITPSTDNGNSGGYGEASLLVKHVFQGDHKISLNVSLNANDYIGANDYAGIHRRADSTIDSIRSSARSSIYDQSNRSVVTTLDYENPISDTLTISLGAKSEINNLDNSTTIRNRDRTTGIFILDTLQSSHYLPKNTIWALYGNVAYKVTSALSLQAGLRFEQASLSARYASGASIVSREYSNIFPSGSVTYGLSDAESLTLSYRRSIALPDIDALNPTRVRWNDFFEYSGNPDLEPEFTNALQLSYNTFWGGGNMLVLSPFYSTTEGSIESSQQINEGVTYQSYANFNGAYSVGLEGTVTTRPFPWLFFRGSGNLYEKVNRGSSIPGDIHSSASGFSVSAAVNVDIMEGLTFSVNMFSRHPAPVGGSKRNGFTYWSFGLRQRLLQNTLTISLRANDPFDLQKWENIYDTAEFHTESSSKWTSRFIGLNVNYMFGSTPRMEEHRQEKTETKGGGGGTGGGAGGGGGGEGGGQ